MDRNGPFSRENGLAPRFNLELISHDLVAIERFRRGPTWDLLET